MGFSDDEQRALDEIERALYAEDRRFASRITEGLPSKARTDAITMVAAVACSAVLFVGLTFSPAAAGILILWLVGL